MGPHAGLRVSNGSFRPCPGAQARSWHTECLGSTSSPRASRSPCPWIIIGTHVAVGTMATAAPSLKDTSAWEQSAFCPRPVTCHLAFPLRSSEALSEDHGRCSSEAGPSSLRDTEAAAPLSAWKILGQGQALQGALCSLCWGRSSSLRSYRQHQGTIHPETASQNCPQEDGHSLAPGPCSPLAVSKLKH